jgi:hypothetical protein
MSDPVLLCGTGQIYCLCSLRGWLATGSRTCPKTNLEMRDVEVRRGACPGGEERKGLPVQGFPVQAQRFKAAWLLFCRLQRVPCQEQTVSTAPRLQVVRLPSVRQRIAGWRAAHGLSPLPPLDPPPDVLQQAGESVPRLLGELRSGDVYKRGLAAGAVNDLLIGWGREEETPSRHQAMEVGRVPGSRRWRLAQFGGRDAVPVAGNRLATLPSGAEADPHPPPHPPPLAQAMLLDLVWLMRQGDPYGSGVAAAALSQYKRAEQVALLAAVAACPAVALLWSPHTYGQHSAARLLASLARASPSMPRVLVEAGAVRGLLQQLDLG